MFITICTVLFFLLFLGVMLFGNYLSHYFERTLNKQADHELAGLNQCDKTPNPKK